MTDKDFFKQYSYLFWDVDQEHLSMNGHAEFIIARLLEKGDSESVKWLFKNYSEYKIKKVVEKTKNISAQTRYLWTTYFKLND